METTGEKYAKKGVVNPDVPTGPKLFCDGWLIDGTKMINTDNG